MYKTSLAINNNEEISIVAKGADYYIASLNKEGNQNETTIHVISVAKDGTKSKASKVMVYWK